MRNYLHIVDLRDVKVEKGNATSQKRRRYVRPALKKHKPLREIVLLTGAVVGSSAATFGVT